MLTDAKCRNASSEGRKIRKLADSGGLYLWVYDDGRKYWRLRYWIGGSEKLLSLGVYPEVSLKEARLRRDAQRLHLNDHRDPSAERRNEKLLRLVSAENSFEAVAREWHGKGLVAWSPSHTRRILRRFEVDVFPLLGHRPIAEITAPELLACVRQI